MTGYKSISIPKVMYDRLKDLSIDSECNTVNEFIIKSLRERIAVYEAEKDGFELSKDDEERIKERLKELGYI